MRQGGSRKNIARAQQPLVSIIIATYNAAQHLPGCLDSIIEQSYPAIEVVVIDGESTDGTIDILQQYDSQISHWVSEADKGIYDALNKGTKLATGKWVYFLGADDRLLPGFSTIAAQLKNEDTIYYGNTKADGPLFTGEFSAYRMAKYCINHQSILYPAKVFTKYYYDTQYRIYADYALNLACWGDDSIKKQYLDIDVAWYALTGFSASAQDEPFKRDKPEIIKKSMGLMMYLRFLYKRRKEQSRPGSNFY
ncbi:glycosyltransferase family 2 protein [Mucilaginibacter terrae]|uniref:Glycosyltransferase involved in cell wall biosynthesis n=1 Tax=Mucilaginibacter terrae TaxID=1955052 RepID=A0ABU3GVQ6_9SPHI|nr:glycosyltransferase family 2 protein [Mucilaginibacter terrae]MDT3403858.1 glycosyltransferase involved in cell wall biosynthesis [Mucilaginibacter terrae]